MSECLEWFMCVGGGGGWPLWGVCAAVSAVDVQTILHKEYYRSDRDKDIWDREFFFQRKKNKHLFFNINGKINATVCKYEC